MLAYRLRQPVEGSASALSRRLSGALFPQAHTEIDWSRGYRLLDQELRQITRRASSGMRRVDVLAQVWRLDGSEAWVLIQVEIQTRPERGFERRMWRYNARLLDHHDRPVATFAVLADTDPN